jgi:hypothetical protein
MTDIGIVHLLSAIYLSGVISLALSLNENRDPRRILRETLRRWAKFMGFGAVLGVVVTLVVNVFA